MLQLRIYLTFSSLFHFLRDIGNVQRGLKISLFASLMGRLKVHLYHIIIWGFKEGNNVMEISRNLINIYGQVFINDRQIRN